MACSRDLSQPNGRVGSNSLMVRRERMFLCTSLLLVSGLALSWRLVVAMRRRYSMNASVVVASSSWTATRRKMTLLPRSTIDDTILLDEVESDGVK